MFIEAIIHYPEDHTELAKICKELAAFRCDAAMKYIESLNLTDQQIKRLYNAVAADLLITNKILPKVKAHSKSNEP